MSYLIYDHWASIKFIKDENEVLIPKRSVESIAVTGDNIHINTGNCMGIISIHIKDVTDPANTTAQQLADHINNWITLTIMPPDTSA